MYRYLVTFVNGQKQVFRAESPKEAHIKASMINEVLFIKYIA